MIRIPLQGDGDGQPDLAAPDAPLEALQHWTSVFGRAQQMLLEYTTEAMLGAKAADPAPGFGGLLQGGWVADTEKLLQAQTDFWSDTAALWQRFLQPAASNESSPNSPADRDRRFSAAQWQGSPLFDLIRQSYLLLCEHMLRGVDAIDGLDHRQHDQLRFATRNFVEALSPANFAFTNPQVIERTLETQGQNLLTGFSRMLHDLRRGQLTHTDEAAFELGRNIAATPGKVIHETPLYQLIHYAPTTPQVNAIPIVVFPPWINRFYILDLNPENSFVKWVVAQGFSLFMVSWKSADASLADITMDDYVISGMIDAIDTVRDLLDVPAVHTIGYCVAGTALGIALAWLAARGEAEKVKSATFFTAQVDFSRAGELSLLVDEQHLKLIETLSAEKGYLDGRYLAATFNMLRGRDLIWSYVVQNYLLGEDYKAFDLLYWNSDSTNLPAKWHLAYLRDLYRDNLLIEPGALTIQGTPIDLRQIETPAYIQAGRDDHIAPATSVWKLTEHLRGPLRFVLAGSGHIAGVVNPPAARKYGFWTNDDLTGSLEQFLDDATEHKGSWWPDWLHWLERHGNETVPVTGARQPGAGKFKALEDAPGRYVRTP